MTLNELIEALNKGTPLLWNDPDPIQGRDYSINDVTILTSTKDTPESELSAYIKYGDGRKATVYISEIEIDENHSSLVLNEKNNIFLWLYRIYKGDSKDLPYSVCPLFWKGLLALLLIILSPVTVLLISIFAMAKGRSLVRHLDINELNMWGVFWLDKLFIFLYCVGIAITEVVFGYEKTTLWEGPTWLYLFGWLSIPIVFFTAFGMVVGGTWILENFFKDMKKIKNGNLKVMTGAIRAKIDKLCPTITWK